MKHKLLLLLVVFTTFTSFSQTTYVFRGDGIWTDITKWDNGAYPGTTIKANDIVEILGKVTIAENSSVTNLGSIETYSTSTTTPEVKIAGTLVNNKSIVFSRATISVDGTGTLLTNDNSTILIKDSSILTNNGSIIMFGGKMSISSISSSILNVGIGKINVGNNGTLQVLSGTLDNSSTVNNSIYNSGKIEVTTGSVLNKGIFYNYATGTVSVSRTFTNDASGYIENNGQFTITGFSTSLINNGNFNNLKNLNIDDYSTFNSTTSSVFISQISGSVVVSSNSKIINSASDFSIREGKLSNSGTIENNTKIFIGGNANLENNGTLNCNYGALINNYGTVSGINIVHNGSFSNERVLSPGNSTDVTGFYKLDSFYTSYTQTATGTLNIDLGGTVAGDTYDQVVVNRDATIAGTLNVTLVDGFVPAIGNVFTILTKGRNLSGTFATVNLPVLTGNKKWDAVEYSSTDGIRISVIQSTLGVTDFNNETIKIKIYPNPVSNEIFVTGVSTISSASIFDLNGRKVLDSEISNSKTSIDLNTLNKGVYLLKIEGKTFKFVKK